MRSTRAYWALAPSLSPRLESSAPTRLSRSHSVSSSRCLRLATSSAARCSCSNGPFEVPVSSCASTPPSDCQLRLICGWVSARWSSNEAADAADPAGASCGSSLLASSSGSSPLASARCAPEASRCSLSPGALSFSASGENALPPPRPLRLAEGPAGIGGSAVSGRLPSRASLPAQPTSAADACIRSSRWSGGAIASCDGKDGV